MREREVHKIEGEMRAREKSDLKLLGTLDCNFFSDILNPLGYDVACLFDVFRTSLIHHIHFKYVIFKSQSFPITKHSSTEILDQEK